ncbi:sugar ABC transporter substrate-binding protein [Intestinibacillus massiliensis]|nr:sugar ABC transporter substrate-binding protein [Intestinibacillus massiliensis]
MKKRLLSLLFAGAMMASMMAGCGGGGDTKPSADAGADTDKPAQSADAGDAQKDTAGGKYKIGMCMARRDQFQTTIEMNAKARAQELGVDLVVFDANDDITMQLTQIQTCVNDKYDGIITACIDSASTGEMVEAGGDLPMVFFCRGAEYDKLRPGKDCYVGCEQWDGGKMQAEYLTKYAKDKGMTEMDVVLFLGQLGNEGTIGRTDAFKEVMKENGIKVNYVFEDTAEWDRAKAMDKFTQFLGTGKHYDAIVSNNDDMALGCIEAITSTGAKVEVPVLGVDATEGACMAIKEGTMSMSASQNGYAMGRGCVDSAIALIEGKAPEGLTDEVMVPIPFEQIDASNVDDMLKQLESAS